MNVKFRNKVPNIFTGPISQKSGLYLFRKFILPICTSHNTRISQVFILEWKYCSLSMCRGPIPRQKVQSIEVCLGRNFDEIFWDYCTHVNTKTLLFPRLKKIIGAVGFLNFKNFNSGFFKNSKIWIVVHIGQFLIRVDWLYTICVCPTKTFSEN